MAHESEKNNLFTFHAHLQLHTETRKTILIRGSRSVWLHYHVTTPAHAGLCRCRWPWPRHNVLAHSLWHYNKKCAIKASHQSILNPNHNLWLWHWLSITDELESNLFTYKNSNSEVSRFKRWSGNRQTEATNWFTSPANMVSKNIPLGIGTTVESLLLADTSHSATCEQQLSSRRSSVTLCHKHHNAFIIVVSHGWLVGLTAQS